MSRVFVSVGVSIDGFLAGPNRGPKQPLGERGPTIHQWLYGLDVFKKKLKLGGSGDKGPDNDLVGATFERIGANIMGKRMFDEGEAAWPEEAPFGNSVFVLTKEKRSPWPRPGGTTFHFTNESLERVLAQAKEAAGAKDVRVCGGANVIVQYLNAGLVDELTLAYAPVLMGAGLRLFDGIDRTKVALEIEETIPSPRVTHVRYRVKRAR